MSQWKEYMTDAMLKVYNGFQEEMEEECLLCIEKLKEANIAGNVKLPHENERGVHVKHGARVIIYNIADYWYMRLQYARRFVSDDFEERHQHSLYNKNIGIDKN